MEWSCHAEGLRMNCTESSGVPKHRINVDDCRNSEISVMWQSFGDLMVCLLKDFSDILIRFWLWITNLFADTPSDKEKEDAMNWIRTVVPNTSSNFSESWKDGILLCSLVERLVPGYSPLPDTSYKENKVKNIKRALDALGKHFELVPDVTPEEVLNYSSNSERKLLSFLCQLKEKVKAQPTIKITGESKSDANATQSRPEVQPCFAKGTGLVVGFLGRLAKVNVFCASATNLDIVVIVKGPSNTSCCERITSRSPKRKTSFTKSLPKHRLAQTDRSLSVCESLTDEREDRCVEDNEEKKKNEIILEYEIKSDRIEMGYIPVEVGQHKITILWHGQHIPGSPFLANVEDAFEKFNDGKIVRLKPSIRPKSSLEAKDGTEKNDQSRKHSVRFKGVDDGNKQLGKVTKRKVLRYIVKLGEQEVAVEADSSDMLAPALLKLDYQLEHRSLTCRRNSWGFVGDMERKKSLVRQFCVDLEEKESEPHRRSSSFHLGLNNEKTEDAHFEDISNKETATSLKPVTESAENGLGSETQTSFDDSQNGNDDLSSFSEFESSKTESTPKVRKRGICISDSDKKEDSNFTFTEDNTKDLDIKTENDGNHTKKTKDKVIDDNKDHLVPVSEDNKTVQTSHDSHGHPSANLAVHDDSQISDHLHLPDLEDSHVTNSMDVESNARLDSEEIEKEMSWSHKSPIKQKCVKHLNYPKVVCSRSRFPLRRKTNLKFPYKSKQTKYFKLCNGSENYGLKIEDSTLSSGGSSYEAVAESIDCCRLSLDNNSKIQSPLPSSKKMPLCFNDHDDSNERDKKVSCENVQVLNQYSSTEHRRRSNPRLINRHNFGEDRFRGFTEVPNKTSTTESYGRKRRHMLHTNRSRQRRRSKPMLKLSQPIEDENSDGRIYDTFMQQPDTSSRETFETDEQRYSENFTNKSLSSENPELPSSSFELFEVAQDAPKHDTSKVVGLYRSNSETSSRISQTLLTPHFTFQNLKDKSDSFSKFSLSKSVKDIVKDLENSSFLSRKTFRENFFSVSLNFPPLAANDDRTSVETRIRQWETTSSLPSISYKGKESKWQLPEREKLSVLSDVQSKTQFFENIFRDLSAAAPGQDANLALPESAPGDIHCMDAGKGKSGCDEHDQDERPMKLKISPNASGECAFYQSADISYRSKTRHPNHERAKLVIAHRLERRHSDPGPIKKRRKDGLEYPLADLEISRTNSVSILDAISSSFLFSHDHEDDSGDEYIDDEIPDYAAMLLNEHQTDAGLLFDSKHSTKPKAEECVVFGGGIYYGHVAIKNHFQVLTKGAGRGNLSVSLQGSSSHDVAHVSVTYVRKDIYNVTYQVMEPGYYLVSVRWSDVAVPGSPFVCKVTY